MAQAEPLAQRPFTIGALVHTSCLKHGHDVIDEIVDAVRQDGRDDADAVEGAALQPLFKVVRDLLRRADEAAVLETEVEPEDEIAQRRRRVAVVGGA